MKIGTYRRRTFILTERDYKTLLRRFDVTRAKHPDTFFGDNIIKINAPCVCGYYKCSHLDNLTKHTKLCPFDGGKSNCLTFLRAISPELRRTIFNTDFIYWHASQDASVKKGIKRIRAKLLSMNTWTKISIAETRAGRR